MTDDEKQVLQDQTDLFNKAQHQARMLEARMKLKDEGHAEKLQEKDVVIANLRAQLDDFAAGQGMVPRELHEARGEKLDRALAKLEQTKRYAEQQRKAALEATTRDTTRAAAVDDFATTVIQAISALLEVLQGPIEPTKCFYGSSVIADLKPLPAAAMHPARTPEEQQDAEVIADHLGTTPDKIRFGEPS